MSKAKQTKPAEGIEKAQQLALRGMDEAGSHAVATVDPMALAALTSGAGMEEAVGRDVFAIPFLQILQPLSPQVNPGDPQYVEGARAGDIYNTVTHELSKGVQVVPVHFTRTFLEWVPRDAGGGFRGEHSGADAGVLFLQKLDRATGKARLDNGNDLVDSRNHYVLVIDPVTGAAAPALITMSSTQIKASKNWLTLMSQFSPTLYSVPPGGRAPACAAVYDLSSVQQENKKGKWYGWRIRRVTETPMQYQLAALAFKKQVDGGGVVVERVADADIGGDADAF